MPHITFLQWFFSCQLYSSSVNIMFKKSNKRLQRHFQQFGLSSRNSRDKTTPISPKTRFSHNEKRTLLRQSFEKSLNQHELNSPPYKKFNDYGFASKGQSKKLEPMNSENKIFNCRSRMAFLNKPKENDVKVHRPQKISLRKRNYVKSQQHLKCKGIRNNAEMNEKDETYSIESSTTKAYTKTKTRGKHRTVNISSESETQVQKKNHLNERIQILQKSVEEYYQLYEIGQEKIRSYQQQIKENEKKQGIIKELYKNKIKVMEKERNSRSRDIGHVFSYRQFPKDFIPDDIITELSQQMDPSKIGNEEVAEIGELSLISN